MGLLLHIKLDTQLDIVCLKAKAIAPKNGSEITPNFYYIF